VRDRRFRDVIKAIDKEVEGTGAVYTFEPTSNHIKVRLQYGGREKLVVMSTTASDWRALKNKIRDVRHALYALKEAG
jgi:hypothetical protein